MEHNTPQKIKLLKIWEILNQKTDPEHQITTQELIDELGKYGIFAERRSIYRDIETLALNGYEVQRGRSWHENTYYVKTRTFDISEIKIVMDAVQSAAFIPKDKTEVLLDKLANLSGSFRAELLKRNTVHFATVKYKNDNIYENAGLVESAMEKKHKISFVYFHLNEHGEKIYTHDGKRYIEEPLGVVFENSNYYLLCYHTEPVYINNVKVFRMDRIEDLTVIEDEICSEALAALKKLGAYRLQAIKMYGGESREVTFKFSPDLIEVVFDKFGHDIVIRRKGDVCKATVRVQISPTLWGWMLQFPTKMKIDKPEDLKEKYAEWVRSAME